MKNIMILVFFINFLFNRTEKIFFTTDDYKYVVHIIKNEKNYKLNKNKMYYWYKSGSIHNSMGFFDGKLLDGLYLKLYKSNQIAERGFFNKGLKIGKWVKLYENGNYYTIMYWKNGLKSGKYQKYDEKGKLIIEGHFYKGKKRGIWINYLKNDTVHYKNDKIYLTNKKKGKINIFRKVLKKIEKVFSKKDDKN